ARRRAMTSASSCAATSRRTEGVKSPLRTGRERKRAHPAAKTGYPACVQASAPSEDQNRTFAITTRIVVSEALDGRGELLDRVLRVAEQHHGLGVEEERILDTREPGAHAPLEHDDGLRVVHVQDRHAVDRAPGVVARVRIDD